MRFNSSVDELTLQAMMKILIGKCSKINFAIVGTQMSQLFCPMTGGPMQLCSCLSLVYLY
jgi:hypothetical protein